MYIGCGSAGIYIWSLCRNTLIAIYTAQSQNMGHRWMGKFHLSSTQWHTLIAKCAPSDLELFS